MTDYEVGWEAGRAWARRVAYLDVASFCQRRIDEWDDYGTRTQYTRVLYADIDERVLGRRLLNWMHCGDLHNVNPAPSDFVIRNLREDRYGVRLLDGPVVNGIGQGVEIRPGGWIEIDGNLPAKRPTWQQGNARVLKCREPGRGLFWGEFCQLVKGHAGPHLLERDDVGIHA